MTSTTSGKILLVEDDQNFGDVLRSYLEMNDYNVTLANDGIKGLESYNSSTYDLCILDVMMPRKDGFTVAREIREKDTEIPIIFLTAKTMKEDVLQVLKLARTITSPSLSIPEKVLFRIQAILKRTMQKEDPKEEVREFFISKYHFNYPLRILTYNKDGEDEQNSSYLEEAQLLRMFAQKINDVLTRSEALTTIWGEDNYFTARSMDVFVTKLRKYLSHDDNLEIVNIHGNGFQLLEKDKAV
ncbi:MAG: response regulator transcription factor [Saprospiraceae bacterium]